MSSIRFEQCNSSFYGLGSILSHILRTCTGSCLCRGLIHVSNITVGRVEKVSAVFEVGDQVKVVLVKSLVPDRLAFRYTALISSLERVELCSFI